MYKSLKTLKIDIPKQNITRLHFLRIQNEDGKIK